MTTGKIIGFIGGGNMAEAIIKGLLAGAVKPASIMVAEPVAQRREYLVSEYGIKVSDNSLEVARHAQIVLLAIKPQMAQQVLADLEEAITPEKLVISIMAGISTGSIEEALMSNVRVVRAMPNTPALIQSAATAICTGRKAGTADLNAAREIFSRCGSVAVVPEKLMDAVTGLSGSGPAYVYMFIEALSDAGVKNGLPRDIATELAIQTVVGSAKMLAETGEHPAVMKEKVTSPGGTTIAGLHALENGCFRGVVINAVDAATAKSKELAGVK